MHAPKEVVCFIIFAYDGSAYIVLMADCRCCGSSRRSNGGDVKEDGHGHDQQQQKQQPTNISPHTGHNSMIFVGRKRQRLSGFVKAIIHPRNACN